MTLLRKLNGKLAETTGYQVRRVPSPRPSTPPSAERRDPAPRAPINPALDRLLDRPVFIFAPVRSGSTLLRMMLNGHSQLHALHELHLTDVEVRCKGVAKNSFEALGLQSEDLEELLWDRTLHRELKKSGKPFLVEKTPGNLFAWRRIAACWPDARFLFLRRHPASIAQSWHAAVPQFSREETAARVLTYMKALEEAHAELGGHVLRYEDLITDPAGELRRVCDFLHIPWEESMLEYDGSLEASVLGGGFGDWSDKIRTGRVQPGRPLPAPDDIPEMLRPMCRTWGYLTKNTATTS